MKDCPVWVVVRPVREKKETAAVSKFPETHFLDYMKEFELLHKGPKDEVIAMDVSKWEHGKDDVSEVTLDELPEDVITLSTEKSPETKEKSKAKSKSKKE